MTIIGVLFQFYLQESTKIAKIDYQIFQNFNDHDYPDCVLSYDGELMDDRLAIFLVFVKNRGEINGSIDLTLHATGAKVSAPYQQPANAITQRATVVANDEWVTITFYLTPEPDAARIDLSVTGVGIGSTEESAPISTVYRYYLNGGVYSCNPPTA